MFFIEFINKINNRIKYDSESTCFFFDVFRREMRRRKKRLVPLFIRSNHSLRVIIRRSCMNISLRTIKER